VLWQTRDSVAGSASFFSFSCRTWFFSPCTASANTVPTLGGRGSFPAHIVDTSPAPPDLALLTRNFANRPPPGPAAPPTAFGQTAGAPATCRQTDRRTTRRRTPLARGGRFPTMPRFSPTRPAANPGSSRDGAVLHRQCFRRGSPSAAHLPVAWNGPH